jgi:hypothetical protein
MSPNPAEDAIELLLLQVSRKQIKSSYLYHLPLSPVTRRTRDHRKGKMFAQAKFPVTVLRFL